MHKGVKIGVLVPTRNRPVFLEQALKLIERQTIQPDIIEVVNDQPIYKIKDVTWRYRIGIERLFKQGVDVIVFWEDDDWYSKSYIKTIINSWIANKKPDILGINSTIYYHIKSQRWTLLRHENRASAMSTIVTKEILNIEFCEDTGVWFDIHIWEKLKGVAVNLDKRINLGIKHGIGLTAGVGHHGNHQLYTNYDRDYIYLKSVIGPDVEFYRNLVC